MVSPAPSPPTTGSGHHVLLGKYKLGRLLGRGSFAKVHQAQSLVDNSDVAIKVIDKSKITEAPYMEERIITEISAMHQLNHPNIIKIHEVLATKTKVYIVMEYAKGGELLSKLNRHGQFPEPIARGYFQQLLSGLHYCHVNGVTHRDIKPENLLLDHKGNLKISDFGLSALPEQLRVDGLLHTACGTPAYTAPEILRRKGYAGTKSDAWSCGVVLFALLAARVPFNDSNVAVMYHKIRRSEFQFPSHFSTSVRNIISKLLDPNPDTRMSIEEVMETAWFKKSLRRTKSNLTKACEFESILGKDYMEPTRTSLNAFDIISMSPAFDLSALLGVTKKKKEERFPTTSSMEEIVEKVEVVGRKLGYSNIERTDRGLIGFGKKESLVLVVQALEVVNSSVYMVEVKLVGGGGGEGMTIDDEEHWNNLKLELNDLKHNDVNIAADM